MRVNKSMYIAAAAIILLIPVVLNYLLQCPSPFANILGGKNASIIWLNFWATYGGSIISVLISLYILSKTMEFNIAQNKINQNIEIKKFIYQNRINGLDKIIEDVIELIDCYNSNSFKEIINIWIQTNNHEECKVRLKHLMDKSFIAYEKFTIHFSREELNNNILFQQQHKNYTQLVYLMQDIQILIMCDNSINNNIEATKDQILKLGFPPSSNFYQILNNSNTKESISNELLEAYSCINQVEVEKQLRIFIDIQRKAIQDILS